MQQGVKLSSEHMQRLADFIGNVQHEAYPELPNAVHLHVTALAVKHLCQLFQLPKGTLVLDIGCGQGLALKLFEERGFRPVGITLNQEDVQVCRQQGFTVAAMDQSFLDFPDTCFDLLWARHVVEHSLFPYFTLVEYRRVLKEGGVLYLEVPATETPSRHELNPNHYSLLSRTMWLSLLERSGFGTVEAPCYQGPVECGHDEYWGFYCVAREPHRRTA